MALSEPEILSLPEACYRAEADLKITSRRFANIAEVREFVEQVMDEDWFFETFPAAAGRTPIIESRSSGATWSMCSGDVIAIARVGRNAATVLHELAHWATASADGHGPIWRNAYLKLVRRHIGFHAYGELEAGFKREIV